MELFVHDAQHGAVHTLRCAPSSSVAQLKRSVAQLTAVPVDALRLRVAQLVLADDRAPLSDYCVASGASVHVSLRLLGGMDFQNRVGSKPGAGGVASESAGERRPPRAAAQARARDRGHLQGPVLHEEPPRLLRVQALPHAAQQRGQLPRAHAGQAPPDQPRAPRRQRSRRRLAGDVARELHGRQSRGRRGGCPPEAAAHRAPGLQGRQAARPDTGARMLLFQIEYPEHDASLQPRHRFMSSFEQKVEAPDKAFQYLLFACEPYETVAFKIPNLPLDKRDGKFFSNWDKHGKSFTLQLTFLPESDPTADGGKPAPPPVPPPRRY
ncbi:hypothetical protein PINS_up014077 [Pythium insidiosum]|nr:hypothetical protein PINS_up014077 [Pythium insidiosum]